MQGIILIAETDENHKIVCVWVKKKNKSLKVLKKGQISKDDLDNAEFSGARKKDIKAYLSKNIL